MLIHTNTLKQIFKILLLIFKSDVWRCVHFKATVYTGCILGPLCVYFEFVVYIFNLSV